MVGQTVNVGFVDDHRVQYWIKSSRPIPGIAYVRRLWAIYSGTLEHFHVIMDSEDYTASQNDI